MSWDQEYKRRGPPTSVAVPVRKKLEIDAPDVKKAVAGIDAAMAKPRLGAPSNTHPLILVFATRMGQRLSPEDEVVVKAVTGQELSAEERAWAVEYLCDCFGDDR